MTRKEFGGEEEGGTGGGGETCWKRVTTTMQFSTPLSFLFLQSLFNADFKQTDNNNKQLLLSTTLEVGGGGGQGQCQGQAQRQGQDLAK